MSIRHFILTVCIAMLLSSCSTAAFPTPVQPFDKQEKNEDQSVDYNPKVKTNMDDNLSPKYGSVVQGEVDNGTSSSGGDTAPSAMAEQFYVNSVYRLKPVEGTSAKDSKIALLTFDDTPYGDTTYQILDLLDQYNAKAIFFVNGNLAEKRVEVLKDIVARGQIIGNHAWSHDNLTKMDSATAKEEITSVSDLIEKVTGERPVYFRPPYGMHSEASLQIVKEEGMQTMNWSVGSEDWLYTKEEQSNQVVATVKKQMHNGANILFHDKTVTVKALKPLLEDLSQQGYRFVLPTEVIINNK